MALSTVSYALSGKRPISEEAKQRVFQAMKELGYQPNSLARALATRRTRIIALLYPSWTAGLGPKTEFVTSIAETATENNYSLLLWTFADAEQAGYQGFVDGAIVMEVALDDPRIDMLQQQDLPFVMIGRREENTGLDYVDLDFQHAMKTSIEYLASCGHTHIALINQSSHLFQRGTGYVTRSYNAFYQEIAQHNLHGIDSCCEEDEQAGYATTLALLERDPELTAFVLLTAWPSGGIIRALTDKGLRIPDDVSLVGIFSQHLATMTTPALTTVDFPFNEMGRRGAQMLIDKLDGLENQQPQVLLKTSLTVRGSSGPLKKC